MKTPPQLIFSHLRKIMISTPRPTIDVDLDGCSSELYLERKKAIRSKIRIPREATQTVKFFRSIQHEMFRKRYGYNKKEAKSESEDPSPYEPSYIFYCLSIKSM